MAMLTSTSWNKNSNVSEKETTTISFLEDETFRYHQRRQEEYILVEEIFEGDWQLLQSDDSPGKGRLCLTVTHIFAKDPEDSDISEKYFSDLKNRMNRQRREQGKIAKALNSQQRELERREMDLGLPGYEKYLEALEQEETEKQDQLRQKFKEQKEKESIKLCSCPAVVKGFGIHKENPRWWCVHCHTTECQLCTKPTCYRGLDADHEVEQNLMQFESEQLRQKILLQRSCRVDLAERPQYYEMDYVDFVAQWRIAGSSTVVRRF